MDAFRSKIRGSEVDELSLSRDVPDLFMEESLAAYIQRNYLGKDLTPYEKKSLAKMDRMTDQLLGADVVAVAYPMFNFSMPASVKAWFDSVMLKGRTWDARDGKYLGLMQGKRALVLVSSGGSYGSGILAQWEHALSLGKAEFQFMGYSDVRGVHAEGMGGSEDAKISNLARSVSEIHAIAEEWYK